MTACEGCGQSMRRALSERERTRLASEIAGLQSLDVEQLRARWRGLYRSEAPARFSRDLLMRGVAYRLQERHQLEIDDSDPGEVAGALRPCSKFGCVNVSDASYCPEHRRDGRRYDAERANLSARGWGASWRRLCEFIKESHQLVRRNPQPVAARSTCRSRRGCGLRFRISSTNELFPCYPLRLSLSIAWSSGTRLREDTSCASTRQS